MHLAAIYRHPIKAIGCERLSEAVLSAGARLPGDRRWAVAHEAAPEADGWMQSANFVRGAKSAALMAVSAATVPGGLTLTHPDRPEITLDPATEGDRLIEWVRPLCDPNRAQPARVVFAPDGMTDQRDPWISILSHASREALSAEVGRALSPLRFRGNLWFEGAEPWAELSWVGREIEIGEARLVVRDRIERCMATHADPETGVPDTDVLGALERGHGHQDFGIHAEVVRGGRVAPGDPVTLL